MVPESYAQGDHIKCGTCGTKHKVVRGEKLRLVLSDVGPLRETLQNSRDRISRLEDELRGARRAVGIGVNAGLGAGAIYAVYQVAEKEASWTAGLVWEAVFVTLVVGVVMELANYLFLAKRQRISRITTELAELRSEQRQLEQRLREAGRV